MTDNLTEEQRRKNMRNIRSKNTMAERMIANALTELGVEFDTHVKELIGKPDFVFWNQRLVVFVDSDFWHRHPVRFQMPKTNRDYWQKKIERNVDRDQTVNGKLTDQGWRIVRVWEYDIKHSLDSCIQEIMNELKR